MLHSGLSPCVPRAGPIAETIQDRHHRSIITNGGELAHKINHGQIIPIVVLPLRSSSGLQMCMYTPVPMDGHQDVREALIVADDNFP